MPGPGTAHDVEPMLEYCTYLDLFRNPLLLKIFIETGPEPNKNKPSITETLNPKP